MLRACLTLLEYLDCLEDVIATGKALEYHQIQVENDPTPSAD